MRGWPASGSRRPIWMQPSGRECAAAEGIRALHAGNHGSCGMAHRSRRRVWSSGCSVISYRSADARHVRGDLLAAHRTDRIGALAHRGDRRALSRMTHRSRALVSALAGGVCSRCSGCCGLATPQQTPPLYADGPAAIAWIRLPCHRGPLIQSIVDELLGRGRCESTGESAARTSWVMEQCLDRRAAAV